MDPRDLFLRALDLPETERGPFLDRQCEEPALRAEVDELLAAIGAAKGFLDEVAPVPTGEQPGQLIAGRYRLLEEIGEGGFGVVWMADQVEPVRRRVAVKILKPGMDTRSVVARFAAERQALALMDHPHIARVFDGGSTEQGRPFFVMELVKGLPITEFCDQAGHSIQQRIGLFLQICEAVEHAHQKGIVHRDLKPGNLLVGTIDGRPVPRVIDFGVAKATRADQLTQLTLFTGFRQVLGTPEYMAPEQTGVSLVDIDTRADVYALGVVLYELLTGAKPHSLADSARDGGGYDDFLKRIREVDPPRLSTRIAAAGERLDHLAERRGTVPARLGRMLRGDLDWIVGKALQKERDRRYPTASALAADLRRHLEGRPVEASPPSAWYRLRRAARQHRLVIAGVTVVFVALVGAVVSTSVALDRALVAEAESRADAKRERAALSALRRFIGDVNPHSPIGPERTLREMLDQRGESLFAATAGQPLVEASVRATVGSAYRALGDLDTARGHLQRALEIHATDPQRDPHGHADALWHLASLLHDQHRFDEGIAAVRESLGIIRTVQNESSDEVAERKYLLADLLRHAGRHDEAVVTAAEAIAVFEASGKQLTLALSLNVPGMVAMDQGRAGDAEPLFRRSLEHARAAEHRGGPVTCSCLVNLGTALLVQNRNAAAEPLFREALDAYLEILKGEHPLTLTALDGLAIALGRLGQRQEAAELTDRSVTLRRQFGMRRSMGYVRAVTRLGQARSDEGQHLESAALYRDGMETLRGLLGGGDNDQSVSLELGVARELFTAGEVEAAASHAEHAHAWRAERLPATDWRRLDAQGLWGACLAQQAGVDAAGIERAVGLMDEAWREMAPPRASIRRRHEALQRLIGFQEARSEGAAIDDEMLNDLRAALARMQAESAGPAGGGDR